MERGSGTEGVETKGNDSSPVGTPFTVYDEVGIE
jgi:hypothetical protein